jgi:hypothetical protein
VNEPDARSIAVVGGTPVPIAWLERRLEELRRGPLGRHLPPDRGGDTEPLRRWIAQELVTHAVLVHEARRAGLLGDGSGNSRVAAAAPSDPAPQVLPTDVVQRLFDLATSHVTVPESDLRSYYHRNADLYRRSEARTVRYAIAESEEMARGLASALAAGAELDRRPGVRAGQLSRLHRGQLVGALEQAIFSATIGDVVGPTLIEDGWVVARVEQIALRSTTPYEEVRAGIESELLRAARDRAFTDWIASRRADLAVIEPGYEHPGHPVHGLPRHRH